MVRPTLVAAFAATSSALSILRRESSSEPLFTIELGPADTRVVTEDEKWALRREGKTFIDITNHPRLAYSASSSLQSAAKAAAVAYPTAMTQADAVGGLIAQLSTDNIETKLMVFSEFYNRYYSAPSGKQASDWLLSEVQAVIAASGAANASARAFEHSWEQDSIIATVPGKSDSKIIVGAHLDSVNGQNRAGRSPGAGMTPFYISTYCVEIL